jgi:hypothetical protein
MNTTRYLVAFVSILSLLFGGCSKKPASQTSADASVPIIKVAVFADGRITADGALVTLDSLRDSFKRLAGHNGIVWYYREAGQQEPPPQAMQVIEAVMEAGLPIRLSSRPDYSDCIDSQGRPVQK